MYKLAEKIADCLKAKIEGIGIDNITGNDLAELGMWTDIIKDIACFDKDMRIIEDMDEAEENDDKNAIAMAEACERIATGQITFAARDSDFDGFKIKKGELLCMNNGKIAFTETDLEKSVARLVKVMLKRDSEFLTVIYGEDVSDVQAKRIESDLNAKFGDKVEITVIRGGQPVYYFFLSVE